MKMHLYIPGEKDTMCGRIMLASSTHEPDDVDCKSCRRGYEANVRWFWVQRSILRQKGEIDLKGNRIKKKVNSRD